MTVQTRLAYALSLCTLASCHSSTSSNAALSVTAASQVDLVWSSDKDHNQLSLCRYDYKSTNRCQLSVDLFAVDNGGMSAIGSFKMYLEGGDKGSIYLAHELTGSGGKHRFGIGIGADRGANSVYRMEDFKIAASYTVTHRLRRSSELKVPIGSEAVLWLLVFEDDSERESSDESAPVLNEASPFRDWFASSSNSEDGKRLSSILYGKRAVFATCKVNHSE